jgi:hypothetical protein
VLDIIVLFASSCIVRACYVCRKIYLSFQQVHAISCLHAYHMCRSCKTFVNLKENPLTPHENVFNLHLYLFPHQPPQLYYACHLSRWQIIPVPKAINIVLWPLKIIVLQRDIESTFGRTREAIAKIHRTHLCIRKGYCKNTYKEPSNFCKYILRIFWGFVKCSKDTYRAPPSQGSISSFPDLQKCVFMCAYVFICLYVCLNVCVCIYVWARKEFLESQNSGFGC